MSIIAAMREYIASCPLMSEFDTKKTHIDWTESENENYGIFPDSDDILSSYIDGTQIRQYSCQITVRRLAKLDADRLRNSEFMERLQEWFDAQYNIGNLPPLPAGCTASRIRAANAMLSEMNITGKNGVYTVQIIMEYIKE